MKTNPIIEIIVGEEANKLKVTFEKERLEVKKASLIFGEFAEIEIGTYVNKDLLLKELLEDETIRQEIEEKVLDKKKKHNGSFVVNSKEKASLKKKFGSRKVRNTSNKDDKRNIIEKRLGE